ncbi:MAG TPA: cupredoxin domain-containing protein [Kofleriaceae bacterium]|nr:cupredoxin domain-containing protein [Kofleriaceae bacterium]
MKILALALFLAACSSEKAEGPADRKKPAAAPVVASGRVAISVTEKGFEPTPIRVEKGKPITLVVTRKTDQTCATEITLPEYKIDQKLPLGQPVEITFTPEKAGELVYGCAMDHMISGVIQVR